VTTSPLTVGNLKSEAPRDNISVRTGRENKSHTERHRKPFSFASLRLVGTGGKVRIIDLLSSQGLSFLMC
jgi:hypothetical protein